MARIVALQNGLGNQMFVYAFYLMLKKVYPDTRLSSYLFRRRCDHNGREIDRVFSLRWDEKGCDGRVLRFYRKLYYLGLKKAFPGKMSLLLQKILYRLHLGLCLDRADERYAGAASYLWKRNYKVYWGGWMSQDYFLPVEEEVRSSFAFDEKKLSSRSQKLWKELRAANIQSVSVHVRRGDYSQNAQYGNICDKAYYERALEIVAHSVPSPRFYLFSDDIGWAKTNLSLPGDTVFIDWNKNEDSWQDMCLMSHCGHHIIANSSFSWWGAWLNNRPDKIVVCPKTYSRDCEMPNVMPEKWIKI